MHVQRNGACLFAHYTTTVVMHPIPTGTTAELSACTMRASMPVYIAKK